MSGLTRRCFLARSGLSFGAIALSALDGTRGPAGGAQDEGEARLPHHRPRAKRVIYLHMAGSPPPQDLFDRKPKLQELSGTPCPESLLADRRFAFIKGRPELLGAPHPFRRAGKGGEWISELMPHFAEIVDEVCLIRSMRTDEINHAPAQLLLHTGSPRFGAASMGSWVTWGLGTENDDLPGFVVMISGGTDPSGGKSLWSSAYLPSEHEGVQLRGRGDPVLYLADPRGLGRELRRRSLETLARLDRLEHETAGDPAILSRIRQYELAFRMQASVPGVMDIAEESPETLEMYGAHPGRASFANNCLLARRLVERGVRFVQLYDWGWDVHGTSSRDDLVTQLPKKCRQTDRAAAALVKDLGRRGLLADTLVVWGGEFGRTPMREARNGSKMLGRDHHPGCFTIWMAGAGIKPGLVYGATDELGYTVVRNEMTVRDLQATILHLLGLDASRLRYPYQGLEQRLIGPADGPRAHYELLS